MSDTVIKVENLSKKFYLGMVQAGSIRETVESLFNREAREKDAFWAIKDISFEVKKGDVLGIIGRNGAGKSTLLKILSRITPPTTGRIEYRGRIASLLEVGTGFHGELSGRENIYLNGTILGMKRGEIDRKLEEIIDFSGIETFIDTPVKRYSSGMYVRLAFAVAAHLEPEILILDEVLAVGDAEFQKKCLGKMKDVSAKEGRTVLFVSHNLSAVKQLCKTGMYLKDGILNVQGPINEVAAVYQSSNVIKEQFHYNNPTPDSTDIISVNIYSESGIEFIVESSFYMKIIYSIGRELVGSIVNFYLSNIDQNLFMSFDTDKEPDKLEKRDSGRFESIIEIPAFSLKPGKYSISVGIGIAGSQSICQYLDIINFEIHSVAKHYTFSSYREDRIGIVPKVLKWDTRKLDNI
jgi:lipopolysaccharide transport system ATP-binding protein